MTVIHRTRQAPTLSEKIEFRRLQFVADAETDASVCQNPNAFPQDEMKLLAMLAGKWKLCGTESTPSGIAPFNISGTENYHWVPGGHFLSGEWSMIFGSETYKGVSILGFHPIKKHLYLTNFDDAGYVRHYKIKVCENSWSITGNRERISIAFAADGQSFTEKREISTDNENWKLHCNIKATKVS